MLLIGIYVHLCNTCILWCMYVFVGMCVCVPVCVHMPVCVCACMCECMCMVIGSRDVQPSCLLS